MKKVTMHLVNTYEAYRADECGKKWLPYLPESTKYYKHELLDVREIELPDGVWYDEPVRIFFDEHGDLELVTEEDGSCKLVSSERIITLFRGDDKEFDSISDCLCYLAEEGYLTGGDSLEFIGKEDDPEIVCAIKAFGSYHSLLATYYIRF